MAKRPLHLLRVSDDAGTLAGLLPLYDEGAELRRFVGGVDVSASAFFQPGPRRQ